MPLEKELTGIYYQRVVHTHYEQRLAHQNLRLNYARRDISLRSQANRCGSCGARGRAKANRPRVTRMDDDRSHEIIARSFFAARQWRHSMSYNAATIFPVSYPTRRCRFVSRKKVRVSWTNSTSAKQKAHTWSSTCSTFFRRGIYRRPRIYKTLSRFYNCRR